MTVTVVVPFRGDDDGPRDRVWSYVARWWGTHHPDWPVVMGTCPPGGPWVKARAVACALTHHGAAGDVLVVADADVICPGVADAVDVVATGAAPWAIPHKRVHRLTEAATTAVLAGRALPEPPYTQGPAVFGDSYVGAEGGGMVVLPADTYRRVPLDPRFTGWGQEDISWAIALRVVAGRPWRAPIAGLLHLWHPAEPRRRKWMGSPENVALYQRYRARTTTEGILAILAETSPLSC